MNQLQGTVTAIHSEEGFSLIDLESHGIGMKSIIINQHDQLPGYTIGQSVNIMFKETEVFIGKGWDQKISLRNQLKGNIQSIRRGNLLAELSILTDAGIILSIITCDAVASMSLKEEDEVTAMIKTNEILLSH